MRTTQKQWLEALSVSYYVFTFLFMGETPGAPRVRLGSRDCGDAGWAGAPLACIGEG